MIRSHRPTHIPVSKDPVFSFKFRSKRAEPSTLRSRRSPSIKAWTSSGICPTETLPPAPPPPPLTTERERERETDRERETQTDRQKDTERERERQKYRERERETERQKETKREGATHL